MEEGRLTLRFFVWPDQDARRARLDAALEIAARVPAAVERADACAWIERRLAPQPGSASVVYHSIVMGYLGREGRGASPGSCAGRALATPRRPRLAPPRAQQAGRRHMGAPGLADPLARRRARVLAASTPHGPPVRWQGP
jgi:hypothetical protein